MIEEVSSVDVGRGTIVRNKPNWACDAGWDEGVSRSLGEMAFLREEPRVPFRAYVVFWAGAPKNAVLGRRHGVYLARGTWRSGFLG